MEPQSGTPSRTKAILVGIALTVGVLCACALIVAAGGVLVYERVTQTISTQIPNLNPFPAVTLEPATPAPQPTLTRPSTDSISSDTMAALDQAIVPQNDYYELACRLKGICNVPKTLPAPATPFKVGDTQKFWVVNNNTNEFFQVDTTLLYITPHTYFWAENGVNVNKSDMKNLMDTFENKIYPKDREFFGSEWTPGVDNDPHIYVIYANGIGSTVAGYFSGADEYNPKVRPHSNGHEAFVFSASQDLGADYTYTVLAHEFVHMIQFPSDNNEVSWINEGFADLGAFLNGYSVGGADYLFAQNPDLQLNDWSDPNSPDFSAHYGNSFLYLDYFLDRFGETATKALTANPENDLTSVDDTLKSLNITDPQTGQIVTADDVFMDWAAALYLQDGSVGDGRYVFHNYPDAPKTSTTDTISTCPSSPQTSSVHQYGIDYIGIKCTGNYTLHFEGSTVTSLLPVDAHSGKYYFWSNKGNNSDMTLTREFDLTNVTGPVTLSYAAWYDVEKDYDYVYLEASEDGQHWDILQTPSGRSETLDPSGNAYGWAYNGQSNGWLQEKVDLSKYAGKKIQVRFEYVTDEAVNGEGFLLDDVHVDAIGYATDFETDNGGWQAQGFARVDNVLPQTFRLSLIDTHDGQTTVQNIPVSADQMADIPLSISDGDTVTLIVTGTTRFTRGLANYSIEIK